MIGLYAKAWLSVLLVTAGVGSYLQFQTNAWAPQNPNDQEHCGIQIAQRLTEAEILQIVAAVEREADQSIVTRIKNQTGWQAAADGPRNAILAQKMFQDIEWSFHRSCFWCGAPKQLPENFPHYRVHRPNCPVDMVCSGLNRSAPLAAGDTEIHFELCAAPFSGYVWSDEHAAWVVAPAEEAPAQSNFTISHPGSSDDPGAAVGESRLDQE